MVQGVYILLCSREEKLPALFLPHIQLDNQQKDLNLSVTILLWQVHWLIGEKTIKEFNYVYGHKVHPAPFLLGEGGWVSDQI